MLRRTCLAALLGVVFMHPAFASDKPLLRTGTEMPAPGEIRPSEELVRVVLGAIDKHDIDRLDACVSEQGLQRSDYASLLRAVRVDAGANVKLWLVRPTLKPFCLALYGAHLFRYFWIEEQPSGSQRSYRLLFHNGGDFFAVYRRHSHGLNDIESTGCTASECRSTRMAFNGRGYRPIQCSWITWDEQHHEVIHPRRCDSDGWRNDQSSGLFPDK